MAFRNVTLRNSQQRAASTFTVEIYYTTLAKHAAGYAGNDSVYQTIPHHIRDGQLHNKHCNKLRNLVADIAGGKEAEGV